MEIPQIYTLVNEIGKQVMGTQAITVTDTSTLVSMGDAVLASTTTTEAFLNTLVQRIGRTIVSFRKYDNQLKGITYDDMAWGAIVQKIKVSMPTAEEDASIELEDGKSVDMYSISKPKVKQKFFINEAPYQVHVTIQETMIKRAFLNATAMGSFISAVYGEVKNYLELALENLGRLTIANYIAHTKDTQRVNLLSMYNAQAGVTLTPTTAMLDNGFLRFAIGQMNRYSKKMTAMSTLYNAEGETRHSPLGMQKMMMLDDFQTACETQVEYAAFHEQYVKTKADMFVPYWQSVKEPDSISLKIADGDTTSTVELENIVGFLFDREALGTYRKEEAVLTTPMNAKGRYTNTYWHENQFWFNDMSENALVFTLN